MSYADRKNTLSKQALRAMSKWAVQPNRNEPTPGVSQQRKDLWTAINAFVSERGGAIVSPAYVSPVRIEVPVDSELPSKLAELGYDVVFRSEETRIGAPIAEHALWGQRSNLNNAYSFRAVTVLELRLPK